LHSLFLLRRRLTLMAGLMQHRKRISLYARKMLHGALLHAYCRDVSLLMPRMSKSGVRSALNGSNNLYIHPELTWRKIFHLSFLVVFHLFVRQLPLLVAKVDGQK
jgi:hypothetical protein